MNSHTATKTSFSKTTSRRQKKVTLPASFHSSKLELHTLKNENYSCITRSKIALFLMASRLSDTRRKWKASLPWISTMQRRDPTFASKMLRCGSQCFAPSVQRIMENRLTEHLSKDQLLSGRSTLLLGIKYLSVGELDLKQVLQYDIISYLRCSLLNCFGVSLRLVPLKPRSTADLLDSSKSWCRKLANGDLPCTCSELQAHMGTSVGGSHFVSD